MNKLIPTILITAGLASTAIAQITVWDAGLAAAPINSTLANTNFGILVDSEASANTAAQITAGTDMWYQVGLGGNNQDQGGTGKGGIFVEGPTNGAMRGLTYVLASDVFSGAGNYTLNFDIWSIYTPATFKVGIYNAEASAGNDYFVDLAGPATDPSLTTSVPVGSTATVSELNVGLYQRDLAGGTIINNQWDAQTLAFTYDGTGDVVLQFTGYRTVATTGQVGFLFGGDMTIKTVVPEPSTIALLAGLAALGLVVYRRRRS